jgi:hypothetical protein
MTTASSGHFDRMAELLEYLPVFDLRAVVQTGDRDKHHTDARNAPSVQSCRSDKIGSAAAGGGGGGVGGVHSDDIVEPGVSLAVRAFGVGKH